MAESLPRYPEIVTVYAKDDCPACSGKGHVTEPHGETLDCDCAFDGSLSPEAIAAIEFGAFLLRPSQGYLARMSLADATCDK